VKQLKYKTNITGVPVNLEGNCWNFKV